MTELGVSQIESAVARIFRKSIPEPNTGCWLWEGALTSEGYGGTEFRRKWMSAHRFTYGTLVGVIPDEMELDHKCRVRSCVNPDHLEPVFHRENIRRGETGQHLARRTHCPHGHEYTAENTGRGTWKQKNHRRCLTCHRERERNRRLQSP